MTSFAEIVGNFERSTKISKMAVTLNTIFGLNAIASICVTVIGLIKLKAYFNAIFVLRFISNGWSNIISWVVPYTTWKISLFYGLILDTIYEDIKYHGNEGAVCKGLKLFHSFSQRDRFLQIFPSLNYYR